EKCYRFLKLSGVFEENRLVALFRQLKKKEFEVERDSKIEAVKKEIRSRVFRERGYSWVIYGVLVYIVVSIVGISTLVGWEDFIAGSILPNIIMYIIITILWPLTLILIIITYILSGEWGGWYPLLLIAFTGISIWIPIVLVVLVRRGRVSMEVIMNPEEKQELSLRTKTIETEFTRKVAGIDKEVLKLSKNT
ncbi:hypothetical protein HKBW3S03_02117, partial [Candidatus Hakubella thermalkaliphila]